MGTTHFKSNIVAQGKNITANTVTATTLRANTSMSSPAVTATTLTGGSQVNAPIIHSSSYFKIGDHQYIFISSANVAATIVAEATAVDASVKGSLTLSTGGNMWFFTSDTAATHIV